jgi:hypothetical protein
VNDERTNPSKSALDRRAALKKAAAAAGIVAWTTPTVQVLTPRVAGATVTNCEPLLSFSGALTGPACQAYNAAFPEAPVDAACCTSSTGFVDFAVVNCGPTCELAQATVVLVTSTNPELPAGCDPPPPVYPEGFPDCAQPNVISITTAIVCGDGSQWTCTHQVDCTGTVLGGTCTPI